MAAVHRTTSAVSVLSSPRAAVDTYGARGVSGKWVVVGSEESESSCGYLWSDW